MTIAESIGGGNDGGAGSDGGLTKNGTGTLVLNGANTYVGATSIMGGTLGGSGSFGGAVSVDGGTLRAGTSTAANALTVDNSVFVTAGGLTVDLFGAATSGAAVGRVDVTGAGNSFNIVSVPPAAFILAGDANLTFGQNYTFIVATSPGGFTRDFGPVTSYAEGTDFTLSSANFSSFSGVSLTVNGNNLVLGLTPTPEPATVLGVGATCLAGLRWVRRRRA